MIKGKRKKVSTKGVLALLLIGSFSPVLWGCSGGGVDDYDTGTSFTTAPIAGQNLSVLIDAATLNGWSAHVNNQFSYDNNIVILDVSTPADYLSGHIPGAQLWDTSEIYMTRHEGVADAVNMALDGASMDAFLQSHGIDERTTIVFTSSLQMNGQPITAQVGRAYFLLRYWGWEKNQLKVLNGYNNAWTDAGLTLVEDVPTISSTDTTVRGNASINQDERASLEEMMEAVSAGTGIPLDARGTEGSAGSTRITSDPLTFAVFDGVMRGGQSLSFTNYRNADLTYIDADTIEATMNGLGIDGSKTVLSYCTTGVLASAGYFAMDAILGWDVMLYDGSFSQWGMMSDYTAQGGVLPNGSKFVTDTANLMDTINYNQEAGNTVATLELNTDSSAIDVEEEDLDYMLGDGSGTPAGGGAAPGYGG